MIELWKALHTFYSTHASAAALRTALTGGMYNTIAPEDTGYPYGTFQLITDTATEFASGHHFTEDCIVQFSLFSNAESQNSLLLILDLLLACFDYLNLTIDTYTTLSCVRMGRPITTTKIDDVWQITIDYRIKLRE